MLSFVRVSSSAPDTVGQPSLWVAVQQPASRTLKCLRAGSRFTRSSGGIRLLMVLAGLVIFPLMQKAIFQQLSLATRPTSGLRTIRPEPRLLLTTISFRPRRGEPEER